MSEQTHLAWASAEGDPQLLAERLGSAEELMSLSALVLSTQLTKIHSIAALREFLTKYREELLGTREFSIINQAYNHALNHEARELIALDQELPAQFGLNTFLTASQHVGRRQLNKLRHLADARVIQRYRDAVLAGKAHAWHTVVYGLLLATYSIPLRQGLLHYGKQTLSGFVYSVARSLDLNEDACCELINESVSGLSPLIEKALGQNASGPRLLEG